jgi:hypothetical protein
MQIMYKEFIVCCNEYTSVMSLCVHANYCDCALLMHANDHTEMLHCCLLTHYDSVYAHAVCLSATVLKTDATTSKGLADLL